MNAGSAPVLRLEVHGPPAEMAKLKDCADVKALPAIQYYESEAGHQKIEATAPGANPPTPAVKESSAGQPLPTA